MGKEKARVQKMILKKLLPEATAQEIQLELIRRTQYNALDGESVAASLLAHRKLWQAVMIDRIGISRPGKLPAIGLIKLRDLDDNLWNADTIYILCSNKKNAKALAKIFNMDDWGGMVQIHDDPDDVDSALGGADPGQAVVSIWWD